MEPVPVPKMTRSPTVMAWVDDVSGSAAASAGAAYGGLGVQVQRTSAFAGTDAAEAPERTLLAR